MRELWVWPTWRRPNPTSLEDSAPKVLITTTFSIIVHQLPSPSILLSILSSFCCCCPVFTFVTALQLFFACFHSVTFFI